MKYNSLPLIWIISRSSATRPTRYENKRTDYPGINRVPEDQRMDVGGSLRFEFHHEKFFYVFFIFVHDEAGATNRVIKSFVR